MAKLYPMIPMQYSTLLSCFTSSPFYPLADFEICTLLSPCNTVTYYTNSNLHSIIRLPIFKYIANYPQGKIIPYYPMQHFKLLS